jgi:Na+/phosphate symporter
MNINNKYKLINMTFQEQQNDIENLIESHIYPKSMLTIYSKVLQIESIKKNLENSDKNFYCSQVLLRILFEHYLVGYYMYFKTVNDENDEIGEVYFGEYFKSELIKRENYCFGLDKLKGEVKHNNIQGYLEKYEILKNLDESEIQNIHKKASQFNIRKIIKYLFEHQKVSEEEKAKHKMLFGFLEKYNKLSSYVHGGVSADTETFIKERENEREDKINENKEWGLSIEFSLKLYFLLLLNHKNPEEILKLKDCIEK